MSEAVATPPASLAARIKERLPRTLRPTRAGRWLLGLTMGAGFAAINTGNNLLFMGWGLMLASILISGLLSEATLRAVRLSLMRTPLLRQGRSENVQVLVDNPAARFAAYAVQVEVMLQHGPTAPTAAGYVLRLAPGASLPLGCPFVPPARGVYRVERLFARTQFPFGFFEKSRRFDARPAGEVVAAPAEIDLDEAAVRRMVRRGEVPSGQQGPGDEFFALKLYRDGDDIGKVHWRRSARLGRWLVRETEADRSDDVVLVIAPGPPSEEAEQCLQVAASLAEMLLQGGRAVGMRGPGFSLPVATGARGSQRMLMALARCDLTQPLHAADSEQSRELWLCADGVRAGGDRVRASDLIRSVQ